MTAEYPSFIKTQLAECSEIALSFWGSVTGTTKTGDNNQVLTEADLAIGQHVVEAVTKTFPDHNIIDEEAGVIDRGSEFTWVIDPIDGTSNFANHLPMFAIMIGLLEGDQPIAGGIAMPVMNQITWAAKGQGAFTNERSIHVSQNERLLDMLVAYQIDGHQENPELTYQESRIMAEVILGIRNLRSNGSTVDYVSVAEGKMGGVLNQTSKIWDNVAPHVIMTEAGALYTDFWGQPQDYSQPLTKAEQNFTVCTASPALHHQLQQLIRKAEGGRMASL